MNYNYIITDIFNIYLNKISDYNCTHFQKISKLKLINKSFYRSLQEVYKTPFKSFKYVYYNEPKLKELQHILNDQLYNSSIYKSKFKFNYLVKYINCKENTESYFTLNIYSVISFDSLSSIIRIFSNKYKIKFKYIIFVNCKFIDDNLKTFIKIKNYKNKINNSLRLVFINCDITIDNMWKSHNYCIFYNCCIHSCIEIIKVEMDNYFFKL